MFVGPSGCGKTTTLKMINRLIEPTSGTIEIGGEDVRGKDADELRRHIGYVIQGGSLFPHMTVADNIAMVPKLLSWDKAPHRRAASTSCSSWSAWTRRSTATATRASSPAASSSGSAWPAALAADPPVLLMDEPFGAVDPITRQRLQDELLQHPGGAAQDHRLRHPRHRRGDQARRPDR